MSFQEEKTLDEILEAPDISMPELFQIPNILSKIKMRLQLFIDFCLHNDEFMKSMISIGIKVPMHDNYSMKKAAHIALQILTCDHDCIVQLFVIDKKRQRIRFYSEDDEQMTEEIVQDEKSGELMFASKKPSEQFCFAQKYSNLLDMMNYTDQKISNLDENCINYLVKVLNTIIRVRPTDMFLFFKEVPKHLDNLIQLTCFPSVSYFLAKFLNELDSIEYRDFKLQIVESVIKKLQATVESEDFICVSELVQQIFNKNKFRNDELDQIKIISQPFVSQSTINYFLSHLNQNASSIAIDNAVHYLLLVVKRMNTDQQKDPYNYSDTSDQQPTMNFEVCNLYKKYCELIWLSVKIRKINDNNTFVYHFYDLLYSMTKHSMFSCYVNELTCQQIGILLQNYNKEKERGKKGMVMFLIVALIQKIVPHFPNLQQVNQTSHQLLNLEQSKIQNHLSIQNRGFDNKLSVLLRINEVGWEAMKNYCVSLSPNTFTSNRTNSVDEFQFVKEIGKVVKEGRQEEKMQQKEKPKISLSMIDNKIKGLKDRRAKKMDQKGDEESKEEDSGVEKKEVWNPEFVSFYSRHLIIF